MNPLVDATSLIDPIYLRNLNYIVYSTRGIMVSTSTAFLNKLRRLRSCSAFFCFVGIAFSCYAFYVETKKEQDDSYVAMCDINEHMSCTKVFSSKYGQMNHL